MLIISDNVWNEIKFIIPEKKTRVGRPRSDARTVLNGIFYIMTTGAQWHHLPDYYGKPTTVHSWFRLWIKTGIFEQILKKSIDLATQHLGNPQCFFQDTSSVKAPLAKFGGKNPTDRSKNGVKRGMVIDMNKIVVSVLVHAANIHDSKLLLPHIDSLEKFINRPTVIATDSACDVTKLYQELAKKNLALHASTNVRRNKSKRKTKSGGRWRIEQVFGMQNWNRGIKTCWAKIKDSYLAFCQFVSAIHNFKLAGIFG